MRPLDTPQSKSEITDAEQLADLWEERLAAELGTGLRPAAERLAMAS